MSRDSLGKSAPEIRDEWKTKHQIDLSTEDLKKYRIGTSTNAVPIFFDLRPITELLSPVYFEFNPDHPVQQFAPFIWFNLRDELDDFLLTEVGLNDQISKNAAGFLDDLSPHRIHVSVSSVKAVIPADKYGNFAVDLYSAVLKVGISVQTFASTDPDFVKYGESPVFVIGTGPPGVVELHAPENNTGKLTYSVPQALSLDLAVKASYSSKLIIVVSGNFKVTDAETMTDTPTDRVVANMICKGLLD